MKRWLIKFWLEKVRGYKVYDKKVLRMLNWGPIYEEVLLSELKAGDIFCQFPQLKRHGRRRWDKATSDAYLYHVLDAGQRADHVRVEYYEWVVEGVYWAEEPK